MLRLLASLTSPLLVQKGFQSLIGRILFAKEILLPQAPPHLKSLSKYLLKNTYYVVNTISGTGYVTVNKTDKNVSVLVTLTLQWGQWAIK